MSGFTVNQEFNEAIPLSQLTEHPDNPRRGDDVAVAESVEANGFYGAVLVHKATGHVLAGNTRLRVAREAGETAIPGFWIDCDEKTAKRILLADNRVSDLAYYDDQLLLDMLRMVEDESGNLVGTGYDSSSMELLMQAASAEEIMGGVRQGATPEDRMGAYVAADIRSLILPYEHDEYEIVADGLIALRSAMSLDTNADVILRLVVEATA